MAQQCYMKSQMPYHGLAAPELRALLRPHLRAFAPARARADTDLDLLSSAIERHAADPSFWLRRAIGWALRQYARTDPEWVRAYVDDLGPRLPGLSRREATKRLV